MFMKQQKERKFKNKNRTALHIAIEKNYPEIIELLLSTEINVNIVTAHNQNRKICC